MRQRIALPIWHAIRLFSVGATLGLCAILFVRPQEGLTLFWRMFIPFVPLLFFLAPGVWRNICPLAAMNQAPRLYGITRGWTLPNWMKEYGYVISVGLFLILVMNRRVLFNHSGPALSILILANLLSAFAMGALFKGKSGWCSSICPLLPVQRIYGQTPFATVPNSHCQPCVGCTKNCYDFNPATAYLADMYDEDKRFAAYRKIFVGLFPGFILAFYTIPEPPVVSLWTMYGLFGLFSLVSLGFFFLLETFVKVSANKVTVLFGALALNTYYWFNAPVIVAVLTGAQHMGLIWGLRVAVFELTLFWIYRTWRKEKYFVREFITLEARRDALQDSLILNPAPAAGAHASAASASKATPASGEPVVRIAPDGVEIKAKPNRTLLELIESQNLPIEAGCRMGVCGADPICVRDGMENLSPVGSDERGTLERLGLGPNTRMACMARVRGACTIALKPEEPEMYQSSIITGYQYDRAVQKVVIVGNGIAGVTAADHVRRRHPHCEIHLIGRERHHLYNRMGITRLIYGRSAMQGLYLMPEKWYDDVGITCWLNTRVTGIDAAAQQIHLGTGETLAYDRLILTTGSESFV
ncbi:MAG: FAD-dependent oxidoreductase, partial [Caldilineaceae bacterium]|nr:FAD-dependent oxidoreductase [Caldilineaceae bacterium]